MISWDRVNELRQEIGDADFADVVVLFLEEAEEVIRRLHTSPNPSTVEGDLHFLKGSAMNLGFDALGSVCRDHEKAISMERLDELNFGEVVETYEASKSEFLATEATNAHH